MRRFALATVAALTLLAACAPTQRRLLAQRHYEEALYGAEFGGVDGGALLTAIERDLQLGLHMQAIGAAALHAQLDVGSGRPAPRTLDGVVLVRVIHDANLTPVRGLDVALSLLHRGTLLPPIDPDRETLAALVGETLPQSTLTVIPGATRYKPIGFLELLGRVTANVITAGLIYPVVPILPSEQVGGSVTRQDPSEADYRSASPRAEALHQWLQAPSCAGGHGQPCRYHLLWPRPQLGGEAPLELAVSVGIDGDGIDGIDGADAAAIVYRLALPPGSLEASLAAMFGDRQRTLIDLHRQYGRARLAVYPLRVLEPAPGGGFTRASRQRMQRLLVGTRRRPGLLGRPGLRFVIDPAGLEGNPNRQVGELHTLLLGLGVTQRQIEIRSPEGMHRARHGLRVEHELPPARPESPADRPADPGHKK